ncbi:carcinine transporter-like [Parasteatoda tepidariorum]|uniref:carcinine transporter-like n=1 Tax=Parasteatoda tepidariorum TaxID=114398 RepID=UPI0039BCDAAC
MLFLVLRIIIGSTMTCLYSLGYIIVLELVSPNIRSRINGVATNCWSLGLCLLPLLAYITRSWVYLSIVMAGASSACFLLAYFILPESPSWLISQEKYEEAAKILEKISKMNCQDVSYEELLKNIQNLEKKKKKIDFKSNSPISLFTYPNMRKRFFFCIIVMIGVSIPYYGLQENIVNLSGNEFLNFFFLSLIEIPAHLLTWWLLNKIGRKKTIKFAFIFTIVFCLIPVFSPQDNSEIQIVVAICGKAGASAAFMAQYQHCPELVPTPLRGIAMGFISTIGVGSTLFSPFIVGLDKHGSYFPYLVFAIICSACGFCGSFLPETLGKVLPQSVEDVENADKHRRSLCTGWCMMKKYDLQDEDSNKSEVSKCKVPNVTIHLSAHTLNNLKCL